MYMELLNRYNMTASREVTSQADIHQTDGDGITASIYGSTSTQHRSNIQIGELHWQTDPTDDSTDETPHPSLTVELDYYEEAKKKKQSENRRLDNGHRAKLGPLRDRHHYYEG